MLSIPEIRAREASATRGISSGPNPSGDQTRASAEKEPIRCDDGIQIIPAIGHICRPLHNPCPRYGLTSSTPCLVEPFNLEFSYSSHARPQTSLPVIVRIRKPRHWPCSFCCQKSASQTSQRAGTASAQLGGGDALSRSLGLASVRSVFPSPSVISMTSPGVSARSTGLSLSGRGPSSGGITQLLLCQL